HAEAIGRDDGPLRADRRHDEIAVPRGQLLERGEQLVALRPARGAPDALLRLAYGQVEQRQLLLGLLLRLRGTLPSALEDSLRGGARIELRVCVDGARDLERKHPRMLRP